MKDIATTDIDLSHHVQRQVIMQLRQHGDQSYQALKPDGMEGNAFNYHLRNLKKAGMIESADGVYTLTSKGLLVSDGFSSPRARLMMRPYAHTAILATSGDSVLLYKASRQPLVDIYCLPSGKMRYRDTLEQTIARELERREISGHYSAEMLCPINSLFTRDSELVIHRPGTLWHVEYSGPLNASTTLNGTASWYSREEVDQLQHVAADVYMALERLDSGSHEPIDSSWEIPQVK